MLMPAATPHPSERPSTPVLQLQGFGVAFGHGARPNVVLSALDASLPATGVDVLMGPVKTGKSTLFRTLAGMYQGHALHRSWGMAWLEGQAMAAPHRPALVQQHARMLDTPVWQVLRQSSPLSSAPRSATQWRDWAVQALEAYHLPQAVAALERPLLNTEPVLQRCVMALAQALTTPALLLLDEPSHGLSDEQAQRLMTWLRALGQQQKLWVSLHHQQQARMLSDRIMLIGGGRVLAHQVTDDFFAHPANEWVVQFIRTGSLSLPTPSARPEDLEIGTPLPPPLSATARAALNAAVPIDPSATTPTPTPTPVSAPSRPVALPLPSRQGVELARTVGKVIVSDSRGPKGFRWVVPGVLAGCPQPGVIAPVDYDLMLLAQAGITHLITLTEQDVDQDALRRFGLRNTHLSIFDRKAPSTSQMHMLLVRMQRLIDAGDALAVHCKAGLGRTGLVLAAWMIRDGGLSAETAIERLRKIQPGYVQSNEQFDFLHAYEADILRRLS
jgi:atypical dual specificity phosphatase